MVSSVARVARRRDVNANQMFYWLKPFREGRLGISMNPQLRSKSFKDCCNTCGGASESHGWAVFQLGSKAHMPA